jgi:hypothetical protein
MSIIDPPASWADIDGINTNERLLGGPSGPLNRAVTGLTARTKDLNNRVGALGETLNSAAGAEHVGYTQIGAIVAPVSLRIGLEVYAEDFGAIGDGSLHPLSERFSTLEAARVVYPHAVALSDQIDWCAIQAAVDTRRPVLLGAKTYRVNRPITPSQTGVPLHIDGQGSRDSVLTTTTDFVGFVLEPVQAYRIAGLRINGNGAQGVYGIGTVQTRSGGGCSLYDVYISDVDKGIYFGPNYEHPLGCNYDRVYVQAFRSAGVDIAGKSGAATSGESAFFWGTVICTNLTSNNQEYPVTVTPGTTSDALTWTTDAAPDYGYLVLRSANGTSLWHVPPNWTSVDFSGLSFTASKTAGESWNYKVVRAVRGISVRRIKAFSAGTLQAEYCAVGILMDDVTNFSIGSIYSEARDRSIPMGNFTAFAANSATGHVGSIWAETYGYAASALANAKIVVDAVRANAMFYSAFMQNGADNQSIEWGVVNTSAPIYSNPGGSTLNYSYAGHVIGTTSRQLVVDHGTSAGFTLRRRGVDVSQWRYDPAVSGARLDLAALQVRQASKSLVARDVGAAAIYTTLTAGSATPVATITLPSTNTAGGLILDYALQIFDSGSVSRHGVVGSLHVAISTGSTPAAVALLDSKVGASATGTLTAPVWTASVSGDIVTISVNVAASNGSVYRARVSARYDSMGCTLTQL